MRNYLVCFALISNFAHDRGEYIMKHCFLTFAFLIVCSTYLYGQDNILISSNHISNSADLADDILMGNEAYTSVDFVDINLDIILEYEDFLLQLSEKNITIRKEKIEARGINNYVFVGNNNEGCRVLLSVLDNDIQGVIETDENVYTIETVGNQQYALITVDYSLLREGCDNLDVENNRSSVVDANNPYHEPDTEHDNGTTISPILEAASANDCKIRVLVLYTPSARSAKSNIKNTILTAVALTNQSFVNSQINYQIELVYVGQTTYSESGFRTDLSRFRISGDGYMDEVHSLRDKYSADVCVLLINDCALCGVAARIGAAEDKAFCAVSVCGTCATSNYSFGHEIGHLLGCRHDPNADPTTTPFAYGHGYVNPSKTWRTIMAYHPANSSYCPRLQYWSNPNVTHVGEPMGTIATNDNARVWNERSNTVMAFRQPDNNVTFKSSDMPNTQYADVIAKQNITTGGTVDVNNGNTLRMRAGNSIILQPGFSVQTGAEYSAKIEDIDDCEDCGASNVPDVIIQNVSEVYEERTEIHVKSKSDYSYNLKSATNFR